MRSLLDTGHFYTTCLVLKKIFSLEVDSNFLKGFSYFHIATLNKEVPYDIHGGIFSSSDKVFPSTNQLKKIIFKIKENCKLTGVDTYIICEPCGGSEIHLDNLTKLRALLNGDS